MYLQDGCVLIKIPSINKRTTCSLSLTHVSHYTALFTCEQASSTIFGTRDNSRITIYIHIYYTLQVKIILAIKRLQFLLSLVKLFESCPKWGR